MTLLLWFLAGAGFYWICKLCYNRGFASGVLAGRVEDLHEVISAKYPDVQPQRVPLKVEVQPRGCRGPG